MKWSLKYNKKSGLPLRCNISPPPPIVSNSVAQSLYLFLSLYLSISIYLSIYLPPILSNSVAQSLYLFLSLYLYLSLYLSLSISLSISPSISPPPILSNSVAQSLYLFLSLYLSLSLAQNRYWEYNDGAHSSDSVMTSITEGNEGLSQTSLNPSTHRVYF